MNERHRVGVTAELYTAYRLSEAGYGIYFPFLTQSKCDLVVQHKDGPLLKVQVKKATRSSSNGHPFIQVRLAASDSSMYRDGDFDLLAMVYEDRLWLFPWQFVKDKTSMSFSIFTDCPSKRKRRDISEYEVK